MVYVTDQELVNLGTKQLNDLLKNLSKSEAKQIKVRRRLLKNRGYAQATRSKRMETKEQLEERRNLLQKEVENLKKDEPNLLKELADLRRQVETLEKQSGGGDSSPSGINVNVKVEHS